MQSICLNYRLQQLFSCLFFADGRQLISAAREGVRGSSSIIPCALLQGGEVVEARTMAVHYVRHFLESSLQPYELSIVICPITLILRFYF